MTKFDEFVIKNPLYKCMPCPFITRLESLMVTHFVIYSFPNMGLYIEDW